MVIQSASSWVSFPRYAVLRFQGSDARSFLQSQLTQDMRTLTAENAVCAAWLSVKGRVLATMLLLEESSDSIIAITLSSGAEALLDQLKRFVFRSKVNISFPDLSVAARIIDGQHTPWVLTRRQDVLGVSFGDRALKVVADSSYPIADERFASRWQLLGIRAQFPEIEPGAADRFVPQALGFERWGGLSFQKGCFPGQEIVARLHYLGKHKRHLVALRSDQILALEPGAPLYAIERDESDSVGEVLLSATTDAGTQLLAVLKVGIDVPLTPFTFSNQSAVTLQHALVAA